MILEKAVDLFLTARTGEIAPSTVAWYASHLKNLCAPLGHRPLDSITLDDLRAWRMDVVTHNTRYDDHPYRPSANTTGLSPTTQHDRVMVARIFFAWCLEEGLLTTNPAARLHPPRRPKNQEPKAISEDDIRALHLIAQPSPRDHALIHCLAETGCRVAGLTTLTLNAVNLNTGELTVTEKGNKTRPVYLLADGCSALRAWLTVRPAVAHEYVFVARLGNPLTTSGVYQILARLAEEAGVNHANPHAFRHAFARGMLQSGLSLEAVSDLMGHSSIVVTAESYAIWTKGELHGKHTAASEKRALWGQE